MTSSVDATAMVKLLRAIREPTSFDSLLKVFTAGGQSPREMEEAKDKLRTLLDTALRLQYVMELDGHYLRLWS